jgi:aminoglycoside 3-N-acetyltransferase
MAHTRAELTKDLRRLGLAPGMTTMLHASVRAVGPVHGGPDEIHLAIADAVSAGGTLMMYVSCADGYDDVGRGVFSSEEEAAILAHQPPFEPLTARAARDHGVLAEFFRSYPGTLVSDSVSGRMAARGAQAAWLLAGQPWDYSYGRGSPLEKLCQAGGKLLLLGSDRDQVTLLHYVEHVAAFPGKRIARYQVPVLRDGKRVWLPCEEFDTSSQGVHPAWPDRFFALITEDFIANYRGTEVCSVGKVGNAESVLMDAAKLVDHAHPIMLAQGTGERPFGI